MTARSLDTWTGAHPDAAIPPRVRLRIFDRDQGRCQSCTRKVGIGGEAYQYDHIVPLIAGGAHSEANLQLLCTDCHKAKTREDVAEKSKVASIRKKHLGITAPKRKLQGPGFRKSAPQRTASTPIQRKAGRP